MVGLYWTDELGREVAIIKASVGLHRIGIS